MKAFIVDRHGKGSGRLGQMPEPELRPDDVLVEVHVAGVNPLDSKIRTGEFKLLLPYRLPLSAAVRLRTRCECLAVRIHFLSSVPGIGVERVGKAGCHFAGLWRPLMSDASSGAEL